MREIAMAFICVAGMMVISLWAMTIVLTIKSGKSVISLFSRRPKPEWLSVPDSIAQYGDDHTLPID